MENQQGNWFNKNNVVRIFLIIIAIAFIFNGDDFTNGFIDGLNHGIKK